MAMSSKTSPNALRRIWHTPTSKSANKWLLFSAIICVLFYFLYAVFFKAPIFTGPWYDKIFRAGVFSYLMILGVSAYSLRTRFMRNLPWKAQDWVWMHMWVGVASLLLALLHADYRFVLHDYCTNLHCITDHYWGMPALYALFFIVVGGIVGRLLDMWQAHIIAQDASTNGVGIAKALKVRLVELQYIIERLSAGKSEAFKRYCALAMNSVGELPLDVPAIEPREQADFQRACQALRDHARLAASLNKQTLAHTIFRIWRYVHMVLVPLALIIVTYHGIAELLTNVLHLVKV